MNKAINTPKDSAKPEHDLADDSFMSASDLRAYMDKMRLARAMKSFEGMDQAEKARVELTKQLSEPLDLTPDRVKTIVEKLRAKLRAAADEGKLEAMVMRFPNTLCSDKGRAINNSEATWPETLTGRPKQAYELWRDHLKAAGFSLSAMIIDWPGGMPGDVGFFLKWAEAKK